MEFLNHGILECVPNISEGRDIGKINAITSEIEKVKGVNLLHVDPGYDANRTVITFAGIPGAVVEAAFQLVKKASEVIDMRLHHGIHPRFGATDVLPLIPIAGISMDETVVLAHRLGERIGKELGIHVYCYEYAAFEGKRRNLSACRAGEYEGLAEKIKSPLWCPDYGPVEFNAKSGATAVGARNFLIAYNINLNTTDVNIAKAIASDIREKGKIKNGIHVPGSLKCVKAIGWFMPKYEKVQVSTNITDFHKTPLHIVFEEVRKTALKYGAKVTGSELVGLTPLKAMLDAGRFYLDNQNSKGLSEEMIISTAIKNLGLDELSPFDDRQKILELALNA